jgi:transposase
MMGTKARVFSPVPAISLDELVPVDHFYRHLDRMLDLSFVRDLVQDCYADGGRPGVDPVVFFKLQLVLFFEGVRSERLLMRLVADRLSVRWYLGYNLDEPLPDHSSLTRIRARYGLEVFRQFFEAIVAQCQQAGLVWGKELYVDATHVLADAALDSLVPRFALEARAAIHAHLDALFSDETPRPEDQSAQDQEGREHQPAAASPMLALPTSEVPTPLPVALGEAECAELAEANRCRHDWIAAEGKPQREVRSRNNYYQRTADFRASATDPDATPLHLKGGGTHLGYQTH